MLQSTGLGSLIATIVRACCFHSYRKLLWYKVMPLHNYGAFKFVLCLSKSASCWHE